MAKRQARLHETSPRNERNSDKSVRETKDHIQIHGGLQIRAEI